MNIESILSRIPEYDYFYTVDELDAHLLKIAENYPGIVKIKEIGKSRKGHPILALTVGDGVKNALCFACPHPNEPIGAMTIVSLIDIFVNDPELLRETGHTWHLIACIDPDGTRLNEGWFKGPFTLTNYARNFYRPPGYEQVEWTFPISYKGMSFIRPIPETQALMTLIDQLKPNFMFSLHNAAFGGAYWYLNKNIPDLCSELENSAVRQSIPLQLGEPEAAYIEKFSPAVHSMLSMTAYYDYMEKYTGKMPETEMQCGTSSSDYAESVCDCTSMMAELPYFSDSRSEDLSLTNVVRRESIKANLELTEKHYEFLRRIWSGISSFFSDSNPFHAFVETCIQGADSNYAARMNQLEELEFSRFATVSEHFHNLYGARIYECLNLGMMVRACDFEIDKLPENDNAGLLLFRGELDKELESLCSWMESNIAYEVLPIRKLVSVQVESALSAVKHI